MDTSIRRHENCIIGLPRCDYVFSSTRSCFIGYGFLTSALEKGILRKLLADKGIEPIEAGGSRAPGENAFCVKICSKIITSQFCIILLNNDLKQGHEVPNANVNMEYGLMLGFNKYVIPFQRSDQELPFNVAGLDTIKYTNDTFEALAEEAIAAAIERTAPGVTDRADLDEKMFSYLLSQDLVLTPLDTEGDRAVYRLGSHLGFNLLNDLSGVRYTYFGNFAHLRSEAVVWRARMLARAIDARRASRETRIAAGVLTEDQAKLMEEVFSQFSIWVLVNSDRERAAVDEAFQEEPLGYGMRVVTIPDVETVLEELGEALY